MSHYNDDDACRYPDVRLMSEGTYYGQHEGNSFYIAEDTLNFLLKCEIILQVMMKHGVCNWEGFENCMAEVMKELK